MVTFHSEKISPTVTRIHGLTDEQMYLVEGKERAALIDTGCGAGSLRSYVESLTRLPVFVLLTHGHVDHAMGTPEFETVYMNRRDDYIYNQHNNLEIRRWYLSSAPDFDRVEESDYLTPAPCDRFHDLAEGDLFDLGGVTIELFACPGHTRGSMVMLLREERTLITGDACNQFTFLFDTYSEGLSSYERNLRRMNEKTRGLYDRVYLSHGVSDAPKELVEGVLSVIADIKAGRADNVPFTFMNRHALIAKKGHRNQGREDSGQGNIVYDPARIWE